jgi:hypothetical protein
MESRPAPPRRPPPAIPPPAIPPPTIPPASSPPASCLPPSPPPACLPARLLPASPPASCPPPACLPAHLPARRPPRCASLRHPYPCPTPPAGAAARCGRVGTGTSPSRCVPPVVLTSEGVHVRARCTVLALRVRRVPPVVGLSVGVGVGAWAGVGGCVGARGRAHRRARVASLSRCVGVGARAFVGVGGWTCCLAVTLRAAWACVRGRERGRARGASGRVVPVCPCVGACGRACRVPVCGRVLTGACGRAYCLAVTLRAAWACGRGRERGRAREASGCVVPVCGQGRAGACGRACYARVWAHARVAEALLRAHPAATAICKPKN